VGEVVSTVLVKCGSHRARRKLYALVGKENAEELFSVDLDADRGLLRRRRRRETGHGGAFRIPAELETQAKAIVGVSGLRDGEDLMRCWKF
jgi:hypothetical protein